MYAFYWIIRINFIAFFMCILNLSQILHSTIKAIILLGIFMFPIITIAQHNTDSLMAIWKNEHIADTTRINALNDIIWENYLFKYPDSAFYFAEQGIKLAKIKDLKKQVGTMLSTQATSYTIRSDYANALEYHHRCLKIREEIGDKQGVGSTLNNIGTIYMKQGNYAGAIDYYHRSLSISENLNDKLNTAKCLQNIALMYIRIHEYKNALEYNTRCLKLYEEIGDKEDMARCYNNFGILYVRIKEYDKALEYYAKALAIQEKLHNNYEIAQILSNIGCIQMLLKNYEISLNYQRRSLAIKEKTFNKEGIAISLTNISSIYLNTKLYDSATIYGKEALKIAQELNSLQCKLDASQVLYKIYKSTNQYKNALSMHELFVSINDSLQSEQNRNHIIHQKYKYEYEKKHFSDSINNAMAVELEKIDQQKALEKARIQKYIVFIIFCFILIIVAAILRIRAIKIKTEKEFLLKEIENLKSSIAHNHTSASNVSLTDQLNRKKIEDAVNGTLNETDWSILTLLCNNPAIKNLEISEQLPISYEGVRSSLKKMYRIFNIQNSNENQRMALVINAIRISNSES